MKHKDLISHLYQNNCETCCEAAFEFEKYLKKHWELKEENKKTKELLNQSKLIIEDLMNWLEDEHMGTFAEANKYIKENYSEYYNFM